MVKGVIMPSEQQQRKEKIKTPTTTGSPTPSPIANPIVEVTESLHGLF